jgi:hypothetical protein
MTRPVRRHVRECPTCERRTRFVEIWQGVWYGSIWGCLACGDEWADGERFERPFKRGWRDIRRSKLAVEWSNAMSPREYQRLTRDALYEAISR